MLPRPQRTPRRLLLGNWSCPRALPLHAPLRTLKGRWASTTKPGLVALGHSWSQDFRLFSQQISDHCPGASAGAELHGPGSIWTGSGSNFSPPQGQGFWELRQALCQPGATLARLDPTGQEEWAFISFPFCSQADRDPERPDNLPQVTQLAKDRAKPW